MKKQKYGRKANLLLAVAMVGAVAVAGFYLWSALHTTSAQVQTQANSKERIVNIYSYRQPELIEPILARFTKKTGIKTQLIFAKKGLIERIRIEGEDSPADLILTADLGLLDESKSVAQKVSAPFLTRRVPEKWRDRDNRWFALTLRARIAFVSKARVIDSALSYEELASDTWRGRICVRSGQHPYNIALFAAMRAHLGEARFVKWLKGIKENLAQKPASNDRGQVRNIFGGLCDLAIGNSYYMGKMLTNDKAPEQKAWGNAVRLVFPTMPNSGGSHVNISGMALARHAPHKKDALRLMEYLLSDEAQRLYAALNFEYPIVADVAPSPLVASWGALRPDTLSVDEILANRRAASRAVDAVGFNH